MITFSVKGKPQGKDRPRFSTANGYSRTYTTSKTKAYEELIKLAYNVTAKGFSFGTEPIRAEIMAIFKPVKSCTKREQELMLGNRVKPTKKPDADNIAKVVLDSLNGIAFNDDSQVVELEVIKMYGETEQIIVTLKEV